MSRASQLNLFTDTLTNHRQGWFSKALTNLEIKDESGWPDSFGAALRRWNSTDSATEITAISLFSGGGGLDIGFHDAGFKILECNEIEPAFVATLQKNASDGGRLEGSKIICQDIHQNQPSVKHVDFIIGGPPCQTFSAASARAAGVNGTDDERGNLFLQYARILEILQPKGFLFENVYRIVGAQSGKPWRQIQQTFQSLGYELHWRILDAADYGVPQFRERLIIVGLKAGTFLFPFPLKSRLSLKREEKSAPVLFTGRGRERILSLRSDPFGYDRTQNKKGVRRNMTMLGFAALKEGGTALVTLRGLGYLLKAHS